MKLLGKGVLFVPGAILLGKNLRNLVWLQSYLVKMVNITPSSLFISFNVNIQFFDVLIHGLIKQTQFCVSFIALWSQNGSFQTPQSC